MDLDAFRTVCDGLPGAEESYPFGPDTPVFKAANGKVFAILSTPGGPTPTATLKCDPDDGAALRAQYSGVIPGYHMNKRHWITVSLDGDVADDLLTELAAESHRLVRPRLERRGSA
jgi:predicted DNA-binding protein (MmcQ/YjbR family)